MELPYVLHLEHDDHVIVIDIEEDPPRVVLHSPGVDLKLTVAETAELNKAVHLAARTIGPEMAPQR